MVFRSFCRLRRRFGHCELPPPELNPLLGLGYCLHDGGQFTRVKCPPLLPRVALPEQPVDDDFVAQAGFMFRFPDACANAPGARGVGRGGIFVCGIFHNQMGWLDWMKRLIALGMLRDRERIIFGKIFGGNPAGNAAHRVIVEPTSELEGEVVRWL